MLKEGAGSKRSRFSGAAAPGASTETEATLGAGATPLLRWLKQSMQMRCLSEAASMRRFGAHLSQATAEQWKHLCAQLKNPKSASQKEQALSSFLADGVSLPFSGGVVDDMPANVKRGNGHPE